jgi:hypothetical protein
VGNGRGDALSIYRILAEPDEGLNREVATVRPVAKISWSNPFQATASAKQGR